MSADCYLRKKQESTNSELILGHADFSNSRACKFPRNVIIKKCDKDCLWNSKAYLD